MPGRRRTGMGCAGPSVVSDRYSRKESASVRPGQSASPAVGRAVRVAGGAIVALANGVHTLDFETGACELLATSPDLSETVQLADGKVDRRGRFIVGSSDRGMKEPRGKLYALDPGASALRVLDDDICRLRPIGGASWSRQHAQDLPWRGQRRRTRIDFALSGQEQRRDPFPAVARKGEASSLRA